MSAAQTFVLHSDSSVLRYTQSQGVVVAALIPYSEALRLDAELVRVARGTSALRLAIGEALDALASFGGHHELGFSSLEAYARERCERSGRWAADTRALSHKLQSLPHTREALRTGAIGWSTAELLARHVTAESELAWLEKARDVTVRELRALLAAEGGSDLDDDAEREPTRTLTVTAHREDSWLLECTRKVAEAVAGPLSTDRLLQSLLAEGYSTLLELVPDCSELDDIDRHRMRRGNGGGSAGHVVRGTEPLAKRSGSALRKEFVVARGVLHG